MRILVLVTDAFGGHGGIAKFNRDLLTALCSFPEVTEVVCFPRLVEGLVKAPRQELRPTQGFELIGLPRKLTFRTDAAGSKFRYIRVLLRSLLAEVARTSRSAGSRTSQSGAASDDPTTEQTSAFDLIICGHLNLLPIAALARKIAKVPLLQILHGIEAWQASASRLVRQSLKSITTLVSVSNFTLQRLLAWSGLHHLPSHIVGNCVDLSKFGPGPKNPDLLRRYGLLECGSPLPLSPVPTPGSSPFPSPLGGDEGQGERCSCAPPPSSASPGSCNASGCAPDLRRAALWSAGTPSPLSDAPASPAPLSSAKSEPPPPALRASLTAGPQPLAFPRTIMMVLARLSAAERYKGIDEVLESMPELLQKVPNLTYLICGDGDDRPRLVAKAKSLGLSVLECGLARAGSSNLAVQCSTTPLSPSATSARSCSNTELSNSSLAPRPSDLPLSSRAALWSAGTESPLSPSVTSVASCSKKDASESVQRASHQSPSAQAAKLLVKTVVQTSSHQPSAFDTPSSLPQLPPVQKPGSQLEAPDSILRPHVVFTGRIPEEEKADHYRLADAFVMAGWGEGFGIVYLEALACGVPVVASKLDASQEAILNGELGVIVDPKSATDLQNGILKAVEQPKTVPDRLNTFSFDSFQERVHKILCSRTASASASACTWWGNPAADPISFRVDRVQATAPTTT